MTAIEEMAGMDVLCSDKTGTLTLNRLTVDKSLIEVPKLSLFKNHIFCWMDMELIQLRFIGWELGLKFYKGIP